MCYFLSTISIKVVEVAYAAQVFEISRRIGETWGRSVLGSREYRHARGSAYRGKATIFRVGEYPMSYRGIMAPGGRALPMTVAGCV